MEEKCQFSQRKYWLILQVKAITIPPIVCVEYIDVTIRPRHDDISPLQIQSPNLGHVKKSR